MNRSLLVLLLALLTSALMLSPVRAQTTPAQTTPTAPSPAVPQVSIAIGTFACKASGCTYELGSGTADALTTALLETGRFSVYERENIAQLTEENILSSTNPTQGFQGAEVLIFGSITKLEADNSSGGICLFGVCLGSHESTVGADLRIVDAKTRRVIAATHVEGKSSSNAASLNIPGLSASNGTSSGVQTALGDMLKNAVNQLVQRIPASYYHTDTPMAVTPAPAGPAPVQPLAVAPASPPAAPVYGWLYPIFFLDEATRQKACAQGFASATAGSSAAAPAKADLTSAEGHILITTSYATTFKLCQDIGAKAQPMPDSVPQEDSVLAFTIPDYNSAVATMAFFDASGTEIGRVNLITPENRSGPCYGYAYYSANNYTCRVVLTPSKIDAATQALFSRADSAKFLVNFGKGIETLSFSRAKFPDLK